MFVIPNLRTGKVQRIEKHTNNDDNKKTNKSKNLKPKFKPINQNKYRLNLLLNSIYLNVQKKISLYFPLGYKMDTDVNIKLKKQQQRQLT